ncbi:MAG: glycosyltransferase family 4 protein [Balneolaceae bacterium]|nr:glycosyltransferase family 4 protein [Balneolaceae bacterium]
MRNVLFIVYYFPPMGGSGVQRPLKFAKYLREFGWNPIILCPKPGVYHTFDESLQQELDELDLEVHRVEAGGIFQKAAGKQAQKEVSVSDGIAKILRRISRLIYYPDNKKGWIKPALKKALSIIEVKKIDLIFSTAPPFSNHILASRIKEMTGLPMVVDYRDSWTNNHFQTDIWDWQKSILRNQERGVVATADRIICLDAFMRSELIASYPDIGERIQVLPHGFDPEDFDQKKETSDFEYKEGALNFLYSGLFYEHNQPDIFFKAFHELFKVRPEMKDKVRLHFQGGLDLRIQKLAKELSIDDIIVDYGYVTHKKAAQHLKEADVLWMISNFDRNLKQIKSGKLFEYLGTGKPILGLVHPSEATEVLLKYGAGFSAAPDNIGLISRVLETIYEQWESDNLPNAVEEYQHQHNRKNLTQELAQIFNVIS